MNPATLTSAVVMGGIARVGCGTLRRFLWPLPAFPLVHDVAVLALGAAIG